MLNVSSEHSLKDLVMVFSQVLVILIKMLSQPRALWEAISIIM